LITRKFVINGHVVSKLYKPDPRAAVLCRSDDRAGQTLPGAPDQLTHEEIRAYLLRLAKRGLSPSSRNVAISGIKFFYHQMLGWKDKQLFIAPRRRSWQLPEVLGQKEVERLLLTTPKLLHRCLLMTAYQPVVEVRLLQNTRNQCEAVTWDRKYSQIQSSAPMSGQLVAQ
jgi:hypothetical protein